ncbi:MAG: hypothetical protein NC325_00065 [Anaeroplasma bactoclasticum]|nr:hypothetical protein [Anaeroplasma bactoclasticum]
MKKIFKFIFITFFATVFLLSGYNFILSNLDQASSLDTKTSSTAPTKLASSTSMTAHMPSLVKATALVGDTADDLTEDEELFNETLTASDATATTPGLFNTFSFKQTMPYRVTWYRLVVDFTKKEEIQSITPTIDYTPTSVSAGTPTFDLKENGYVDLPIPDGVKKINITLSLKLSTSLIPEVYYITINHNTSKSDDATIKSDSLQIVSNEGLLLCDSFAGNTLTIKEDLPYNTTGFSITAEPNYKYATIDYKINNINQSSISFSYGEVIDINSNLFKELTYKVDIIVTSESNKTKTYTGTIKKAAADDTETFTFGTATAYYYDETGAVQEKTLDFSKLETEKNEDSDMVEESKPTVDVYGTDSAHLLPFSTYQIKFKIKPDSSSAKVYIDAEEALIDEDGFYEFTYDVNFSLTKRSERKRLLIKTQKFQLLRPGSKTSGGGEYYLYFSTADPDKERTLNKVSAVHIENQGVLSELTSLETVGVGLDKVKNSFEIKKSLAGTPEAPGSYFKLSLDWKSGYTKAYVSKTEANEIVNSDANLYREDTIWTIGDTLFIYLKSQDGEFSEYIVETKAADERSTENGIENVVFQYGNTTIPLSFTIEEETYDKIVLPYIADKIKATITLKDKKETLFDGDGFIYGTPTNCIVEIDIDLSAGEVKEVKLQGISEKETAGVVYSFSFERSAGNEDNFIEELFIQNIDCEATATGQYFDKAFSKDCKSFSMFFPKLESQTSLTFRIAISQFALFQTSISDSSRIDDLSWSVLLDSDTDIYEFTITVLSEVDQFTHTEGRTYAIRIYFADTQTTIQKEQFTLSFDDKPIVDIESNQEFEFDSTIKNQPKITVPYATKSIQYSITDFLGDVSFVNQAATYNLSGDIPLRVGENVFDLKVYSELGKLSLADENVNEKFEAYTLTIERSEGSKDVSLDYLAVQIDSKEPNVLIHDVSECISDTYDIEYVEQSSTNATITASLHSPLAKITSSLENIAISFSDTIIKQVLTLSVEAEDEDVTKDYQIILWTTRANPSSDITLKITSIRNDANAEVKRDSVVGKPHYTIHLTEQEADAKIKFTLQKPKEATLVIVDPDGKSISNSTLITNIITSAFSIPTNSTKTIQMYVIAEDKTTSNKDDPYIFTIIRDPNTDATLSELSLNGTRVEGFLPTDKGGVYTINVSNEDVNTYTLTGILNQETSRIVSNTCIDASLSVGENVFELVTLAEDNVTSYTYQVIIIKDAPRELTGLEAYVLEEQKQMTPSFSKEEDHYQVNLTYQEKSLRFEATTYEQNSIKLIIDGEEFDTLEITEIPYGTTLSYILRVYTASQVFKDYEIAVFRAEPSHDATLSSLSLALTTFEEVNEEKDFEDFEAGVVPIPSKIFISNVEYDYVFASILAEPSDVNAKITSDPITDTYLEIGDNDFEITCLAEDETTTCTYYLKVVRDAPTTLDELEIWVAEENVLYDFTPDEVDYAITIDYPQDEATLVYGSAYLELGLVDIELFEVGFDGNEQSYEGTLISGLIPDQPRTFKIHITAQSGAYKDYTVEICRDSGSDECFIESFGYKYNEFDTEIIALEMKKTQFEYFYAVDRTTTTFDISQLEVSLKASYTLPDDLDLIPGVPNVKKITVTSENGKENEYTFTIYPADINATITDINLLDSKTKETLLGVDNVSFIDYENGIYTLILPNAVDEVYLEVLKESQYATVLLDGEIYENKVLPLALNENKFDIYIQSEYAKLNPQVDVEEKVSIVVTRAVNPIVCINRTGLAIGEATIEQEVLYGDSLVIDLALDGHILKKAMIGSEEIIFPASSWIYTKENLTNDLTIDVEYEPIIYEITVDIIGSGSITPAPTDGKIYIPFGSTQQFDFIPDEGYGLKEISLDGSRLQNVTSINLSFVDSSASDHEIKVTFEILSYPISLEVIGEGTVKRTSPVEESYSKGNHSFTIEHGTTLDLEFISTPGNELKSITINGEAILASKTFTQVIKGPYTISVEFGPILYEIELENVTGNGQISPSDNQSYYYHEDALYTFIPASGYHVSEIVVDGDALSEDDLASAIEHGYTFTEIEESHKLSVSFAINIYAITITQTKNGMIKDEFGETLETNVVEVEHASSITFTIAPLEGCSIVSLIVDGTNLPASDTYTFSSVVMDHSISAVFKGNTSNYSVYHHLQYIESDDYEEIHIDTIEALVNDEIQYLVPFRPGFEAAPIFPITVLPNDAARVDVYYKRLSYELTHTAHQGLAQFNGAGTYKFGEAVVIEATFNQGYRFAGFTTNDEALLSGSTENPYSFTMPAGDILIDFDLTRYYQINIAPTRNGVMSINPGVYEIAEGENLTITFEPNEGYVVDTLIVNSIRLEEYDQLSYTFQRVRTDYSFSITFKQILFTITTTLIENGIAAFEDTIQLPYGSTKEITILPRTGYRLVNLIVDDESLGAISSYTLENILQHHTIQIEVEQLYYRIVVSKTEGGSINPVGNAVVMHGADKFFTFIPEVGYYVKNVKLDNREDLGSISNYIFENVTNDHSLSVEFAQYTYTIETNTPQHGEIEADGSLTVNYGENRTLTFLPEEGYVISDVIINNRSVGALSSYTLLNILENQSVEVLFDQIYYTIEVQATEHGTLSPNETCHLPYGGSQEFIITPEEGYYISRLEIDGHVIPAILEYKFENILENHSISVEFEKLVYTIDIDIDGQGDVDLAHHSVVDYGTDLTIHIVPEYGQRVRLLEIDGQTSLNVDEISLPKISQNHQIHIAFEQITYTLSIAHRGNGSIQPDRTSIIVNYGENQTFSFLPARGNGIKDVLIDGVSIGAPSSYTLENILANHTVLVEFEELFHTITVSVGQNGTADVPNENIVAHDSNLACRFVPNEGYVISNIIVDGESVGNDITGYYFSNITSDHTLEVEFTEILFDITVFFGPHGKITYPTEEGPVVPNDKISIPYGSDIEFEITADEHYFPKIWINGEVVDTTNQLKLTSIMNDYMLQIDFTQLIHIDITTEGNGTAPESSDYEIYTPLTLVFKPDLGNQVKEVLVDGKTVGKVDNYTFSSLLSDHNLHIIFEQTLFQINYSIHGQGSIEGNKDLTSLTYGDSATLTITPAEGWTLEILFVDGEQTELVNNQIVINNVDSDVEIVVYFSQTPVRSIPMWIIILLAIIILILIILLILVSIWNKKRKDRYRY